jgi:uncharacterized protein YxeA
MPQNTYKKRLRSGWRQGKLYKSDSEERQFSKREIVRDIEEDRENYLYRHKGRRKRNVKASWEYRIDWYQKKIAEYERAGQKSSVVPLFRTRLAELKEAYAKLKEAYAKRFGDPTEGK